MADVINLRQARKGKARREREQTAAEKRRLFGRTKDERVRETAERERAAKSVDAHKRETD